MKVVILAGGLGTRLAEETEIKPKPMVEIGGYPILWHIMKHYAQYGFKEFVIALGYKGEIIKRFFLEHATVQGNLSLNMKTGSITARAEIHEDWLVHLVDTGLESSTGGRIGRVKNYIDNERFMLTYGDGVSNMDLQALITFHEAKERVVTLTAVRPPARFGGLIFNGDLVQNFTEKPQVGEGWINGGFMVMEPKIFDYIVSDATNLEGHVLEKLASEGQLAAYRHEDFWQCMDTLRDKKLLESLWQQGNAPMENMELNSSFWLDRLTFVTGGTGLVGSWLIKRLVEAGTDVTCLVRDWVPQSEMVRTGLIERVKVVRGDVRDQATLERILAEYEIDTVIHLAAQTIVTIANRNPVSTFETNIGGTWALLEACRRSPKVKQIVVASSDKAYGDQESLPYAESASLQGQHPYDVSKSCADLIAHTYAVTFNLPVAVTRCGNFYGGGDLNWNRIIPGTIRSILRGQRPIIRSDGEYIRDYFYVEDGAAAYMHLAEQLAAHPELKGEAFNFSNEIQVTVKQIVAQILAMMNSNLQPNILNEVTNEIRHQYLSAEKARTVLSWKPIFSLEEGLQRTINWYEKFLGEQQ